MGEEEEDGFAPFLGVAFGWIVLYCVLLSLSKGKGCFAKRDRIECGQCKKRDISNSHCCGNGGEGALFSLALQDGFVVGFVGVWYVCVLLRRCAVFIIIIVLMCNIIRCCLSLGGVRRG